ncbi:MAG: ethanolamine permease [Chitinophaga sp.]|jgi:ethanolamine permease|nr:ethanolamine permease [Chitinophaga sp.]
MQPKQSALKKTLTATQVWAIAVGLVISGEYFGWNYGWGVAGTMGLLIATLLVTVLYISFVFSFTELTAAIPNAGGPFAYALNAIGPIGALIAGYATLVEFLLAAPAIAVALGSYVHFLYPQCNVLITATVCYVVFTFINLLGIKESAVFNVIVTLLAIGELLLFIGVITPHFQLKNFMHNNLPFGYAGVFAALPFAIWFYLAIEGTAMVAEETNNPQQIMPKGYIYGIATLTFLALAVMIVTGGITDWQRLSAIDYPLPESIGIVLGKNNTLTKFFAGIGLFGLIASFHGIIIGYSRQLFALSRADYLPKILSKVNSKTQVPHWALIAGGLIGVIAVYSGGTDKLIILSAIGAVVMYIVAMISLLVLRKKQPGLHRPFVVPLYPYFPVMALVLSFVCLIAIIYYNILLSVIFFGVMTIVIILFLWLKKDAMKPESTSE